MPIARLDIGGPRTMQTMIVPHSAIFTPPNPQREAAAEERRVERGHAIRRREASVPHVDAVSAARFAHSNTVEVIANPPRGEGYGLHKRIVQIHRLDLLV